MSYLLIGIDTESDNQWDVGARRHPTFENLHALHTLHDLFDRCRVRPTYLVTYPVVKDRQSVEVLRKLRDRGDCEIGAHHHVWETPPCSPDDLARHGYALSLPRDQFAKQVDSLTHAIHQGVGERPLSYRSGRFGFSAAHVYELEQAGYRIESSVTPLFYEAHKAGPDFVDAPLSPYFLAYDDACAAGTSNLLELPVSAALNRPWPRVLRRLYGRAPKPYATRRLLRKLGVAHVVWLRPSYSSLDQMQSLARRLKADGEPLLNVLFHSSEAIVGGSPYNRTSEELDAFLSRLEQFLVFAVDQLGAIPVTFSEFRALYCGSRVEPREREVATR